MNINKQQVEAAVGAGLSLLSGKNKRVPYNDGLFFLKQLLVEIAAGRIGLVDPVQREKPAETPKPEQAEK